MFEAAGWGIVGGMFAELLKWHAMREQLHRKMPDYAKTPSYWVVTSLMILAGGVVVVVHQYYVADMHPFLAINLGASAPLLLRELAHTTPDLKLTL